LDSHLFRLLAADLSLLAEGARLEKIHGPRPGLFVFTLFASGRKYRLILLAERRRPALFLAREAPENPSRPPARVMFLRKHCQGRRLGRAFVDYPARRMAFPLGGGSGTGEKTCFLLLDLVEGAHCLSDPPPGFGDDPAYPPPALAQTLCSAPGIRGGKEGPWQDYAVLTPLLRESLSALPVAEGQALLADLRAGGGEVFFYAGADGEPSFCSAWPLTKAQEERMGLIPLPAAGLEEKFAAALPDFSLYPALSGVSLIAGRSFSVRESADARWAQEIPRVKAAKKRARLLAKLDREEERLKGMAALGPRAEYLKTVLWNYPPSARFSEIPLPDECGGETLTLDKSLSLSGNMERMFKEAARGKRGLVMLGERRKTIACGPDPVIPGSGALFPGADRGEAPSRVRETELKDIAVFRSLEGFAVLRGKNARGNARIMKTGAGHDLWLHAGAVPGAHVLVRRSHALEEVPENTLLFAAALAAEKSALRGEGEITVALLRHVRAVKGGPPGMARVDAVLRTLFVRRGAEDGDCSAALEERNDNHLSGA
jgi:hypothetical protein